MNPRSASRLPAVLLAVFLLAGVGCTNLTYRTVAGPDRPGCGGYHREIEWRLKKPASADGWVVQKMTVTFNILRCDDTQDPTMPSRTFWEAWPVARGNTFSNPRTDTWNVPRMPNRKGSWSARGEARFYPGVGLPGDFVQFNPNTYAGTLHSSTTEPPFWSGRMVVRRVEVEFDCCEHNTEDVNDTHDR